MLVEKHRELVNVPPAELQHLFHELHLHQIELKMQNEELREAQHTLEANRQKYFELYDPVPVGYVYLKVSCAKSTGCNVFINDVITERGNT